MTLTAQQANLALANVTTADQLRSVINQLSIYASGSTTVLYSGTTANGVSNSQIIQGMLRNGENIRVIDNTEAAKFLDLRDPNSLTYNRALADKLRDIGLGDQPMAPGSLANRFLFGDVDANGARIPNGAWDNVSGRFVDATVGEVRTLTGGAGADRIFGQTEVPRALANTLITSIDGIPHTDLQTMGAADAFKAISAQSDVYSSQLRVAINADGTILRTADEQIRIDSRGYFDATGLEGRPPTVDAGSYANLAEHMPNRLSQHEAGAQILQDVQARYETLARTPDLPGVDNSALRASALRALDKLGWAGDLLALGLVAREANAAYADGNTNEGHRLLAEWAGGFAGGLAGGLLAAKIAGAALAPLYLTGPAGAMIARSQRPHYRDRPQP